MSSPVPKTLRERFIGVWQYVPGGALLFAVIPLVVLSYLGWFYYGASHLDQALYAVTVDQLTVTPQPDWITRSDVRGEVFQQARLDRISLLDPQSSATIAQAFESHPWIRSTSRVTKSVGGKVAVDVVYRRPVAMVYCQPRPSEDPAAVQSISHPGFFPIDAESVMLPVQDFTREQVLHYFLIMAEGASPSGQIGMAFGDVRISEALKVCELLEPERNSLRLQRVYVDQDHRSSGTSPWIITLETVEKHLIRWGHRPTAEGVGEPSASDKLITMTAWLESQRAVQSSAKSLDLLNHSSVAPVSRSSP